MYTSKYYSCEQIDQRLLQGYYDDAVNHGFTGNIAEFWALVLSISSKVTMRDGYDLSKNDFTDILKDKLVQLKVPDKISAFTNDSGYITLDVLNKAIETSIRNILTNFDSLNNYVNEQIVNIRAELAKIKPLTEEEVNILVNDILEV